jgi:hypothetical protein
MPQYLNEKPWEHQTRNGTIFRCKRCDFKGEPIVVTNWPRTERGELIGESFAADVAEMIGWWTVNIMLDDKLDPRIGFSGFDTIEWDLLG